MLPPLVWRAKTKSYWQNSFINQNQCKQHILVPPLVNSFSSVPVTSPHKGYVKCLLLSITEFGINLCLLFYVSYINYEWKYYIKTREVVSKDYQTWVGRKMKIIEILNLLIYVWIHGLCSVFRLCGIHWTWFVWLDISLHQIKPIKITIGGCSKEIDTIASLLAICFSNQISW